MKVENNFFSLNKLMIYYLCICAMYEGVTISTNTYVTYSYKLQNTIKDTYLYIMKRCIVYCYNACMNKQTALANVCLLSPSMVQYGHSSYFKMQVIRPQIIHECPKFSLSLTGEWEGPLQGQP